jgi:hypothetical protein
MWNQASSFCSRVTIQQGELFISLKCTHLSSKMGQSPGSIRST